MLRRGIAIAALATLAAACSLTSLDGLSGGEEPGGAPDADATTQPADASLDALVDATTGVDADAGAVRFCESAPAGAFCDDFEGDLTAWNVSSSGANSVAIDGTASTSPTRSLLSTVKGSGSACLKRTFEGSPSTIEVDVDVRFEALAGAPYDFLSLGETGDLNISLQVAASKVEFDEDIVPIDGGPDDKITSTGYTVDANWHHFRWTNELNATTANAELFVDGAKIGAVTVDVRAYAAPLVFSVGDCSSFGFGLNSRVRFDNVVVVTK